VNEGCIVSSCKILSSSSQELDRLEQQQISSLLYRRRPKLGVALLSKFFLFLILTIFIIAIITLTLNSSRGSKFDLPLLFHQSRTTNETPLIGVWDEISDELE
jgi:hypothetical protein